MLIAAQIKKGEFVRTETSSLLPLSPERFSVLPEYD